MHKLISPLKNLSLGLFLLSAILALIQNNAFIPILIFALISYWAIHLINLAISRDLKNKEIE
ncbi:hypothetical protein [Methylomonas sp. AM2-LC]|uniref:hypothetical protein n=1 Tax=Methylomonas sp. AM2-LC TaxID=3153301 RepID=UPI0032649FC7